VVPVTAEELARAREELTSFRALVGADDPRIRRGEAAIRIAPSATFTTSEERARAREGLQRIDDDARQFLGAIRTTERSVTLTGRRARIPISFRNDTGQPVRVRVHLASSKLIFPEGADHLVELAEGNTTERFPVEARTSGTFTLTVSMTSEDGMLQVGSPTEVTVRTTIFSGMGAWLSVGALVFLALWWASHHLRARRGRRSDPQPA
jgi:hypothetical protein